MPSPLAPSDERTRLEALRRYRILDTTPEEAFDDLVHLAALICRTPISLISLIDATRQWFKAKVGLSEPELPRESAFCTHAIVGSDLLVVPDAHADPRFANNPLVVGVPHIRFYAGAPLVTPEGFGLGTICVIDRVPRMIGAEEARSLQTLAREVMTQLELRRLLIEIGERNAELDAFAHSVAHDLRAPLRGVRGLCELIQADYSGKVLSGPGEELIGRAIQAAGRMESLIDGLLAYAKVSRGPLELEPVDVGALVSEILNELSAEIESSRGVVEVDPALPTVRGHRPALRQALANLLSNALKFVAPGVAPRVTVSCEVRGDRAVLSVSDNGIGIPPDLQDRLFKPFSRLHAQDSRFAGVGIGLALVQKATERMGGRAGVESAPGRGSRFWIDLPLLRPAS